MHSGIDIPQIPHSSWRRTVWHMAIELWMIILCGRDSSVGRYFDAIDAVKVQNLTHRQIISKITFK